MAFLLEQAEDGRKLVRWATNSAIEWLDATVPVSNELGSRRSRQRASRDGGGGGGGRTLRQRQPQRKSRAGTAKATPLQEPEITEAAVIQEQGTGTGNTKGTADYAESTDNPPKETQVSTQKRKRNDWRGEASSEEEEFEFDDNNEDDEDYKDDNNEDDDDDDDAILFSAAEESLSDEDYVESSTKRSKKNKRSTKRASLVRGRSKRKKNEKSMDEEAMEKSAVENCGRGVEGPPVENVPLLGSTVPVDELSPVDKAREISGVVEVIETYTSNNEVVSKDDQDNATDPLNQTDEPNVLEATATDFTRDPKESVQDVVLLDSKNGLLDKDQEVKFSETMEAAPRAATENNEVSDYHTDMPSDNSTLPLEKQLIIQEVPAIGFSGAADESGNNWEINDALSLSTDGLPVDHETMIACPSGGVDEVRVILENENNGTNSLLHDNNDSGNNDGSPLDSNNGNKTAEEIAIATSEVDVGDSGIVNGLLVPSDKNPVNIQANTHEGAALPTLDTVETESADIGASDCKTLPLSEQKNVSVEALSNLDTKAIKNTRNEALTSGIQVDQEQKISAGNKETTLMDTISDIDVVPSVDDNPIEKKYSPTKREKIILADAGTMEGIYDDALSEDSPPVGGDKNDILIGGESSIQETTIETAIVPCASTGDVESGSNGLSVDDIHSEKDCIGTSVAVSANQAPPVNDAIPVDTSKTSDEVESSDSNSDANASQSKSVAARTKQSDAIDEHDRAHCGKLNEHPRDEASQKDSENMSVIKEKQSAGQSTESENFISKLVIQPTPKNSEHISKDSTMIPPATKVEERKPVLQSKMIEVSKKAPVQQNPPNADKDLVPISARVHYKESATKAFASQRNSVILGRAEMQAPTGSNKIVTGDKPIVIGRPGGESSVDKVVILERKMQFGTDLDNNTKQVRAVAAKKKAASRGVPPLRKNVGKETVLKLAKPGTSLSKNKKKRQLKDSSTKIGDSSTSSLGDTAPAKRVRLSKSQKGTGRSTTEERNREPAGHPQTFALNMEARERERGARLSTMNKIAANEDVHRDGFGFETSAAPIIPTNATTVAPGAYNLDARLQMALQSNHLARFLVSQTQAPGVPPSFIRQHDGSAIGAAVSLARQRVPLPPRNAIEVALQKRSDGGTQAINITLDAPPGGSSAALGQAHPPSSSSLLVSTILRNRNRPTSAHGRDPPGRFRQKKQT